MCELEHHRSHKKEVHLFKKVGSLWVVALYLLLFILQSLLYYSFLWLQMDCAQYYYNPPDPMRQE